MTQDLAILVADTRRRLKSLSRRVVQIEDRQRENEADLVREAIDLGAIALAALEQRVEERKTELEPTPHLWNPKVKLSVSPPIQELQESEERFRLCFDRAANGMAIFSYAGKRLTVNPALGQMLGYLEQEFCGLTLQQIVHPEDLASTIGQIQRLLSGGTSSAQLETRFWHKGGSIVWVLCHVSLVRNRHNQPLHLLAQIQDITEQREKNTMKQEFISIVSHELRTPLSSILGSLALLAAGILDDEPETTKHMLKIAQSEAERLVRLVNDLLDLERLEANMAMPMPQWCEADRAISSAIASLQALTQQHSITVKIAPNSLRLWADGDRLVQVLVNLLSNAIKFSPIDSTIEVLVERISSPTPHSRFQVRDRGRGIPAPQLELIFRRFYQVEASDSRSYSGVGLGLAICHSIVQQHGGQIWVESTLGEGSTFYFTLPLPSG